MPVPKSSGIVTRTWSSRYSLGSVFDCAISKGAPPRTSSAAPHRRDPRDDVLRSASSLAFYPRPDRVSQDLVCMCLIARHTAYVFVMACQCAVDFVEA